MPRIKDLPMNRRPREKLRLRGAQALSDTELVAAVFGSGGSGADVMQLAAQTVRRLARANGSLDFDALAAVHGIGPAKAAQLLAGFELARRYQRSKNFRITGPETVVPLLHDIARKKQEYFVCVSLNGAHEVIEKRVVTVGLLNRTQIHPREVFADVIVDRAAAVVLAHNHPSGDVHPSDADRHAHRQLTDAASLLGIDVLDHVIVGPSGFFSFRQAGLVAPSTPFGMIDTRSTRK